MSNCVTCFCPTRLLWWNFIDLRLQRNRHRRDSKIDCSCLICVLYCPTPHRTISVLDFISGRCYRKWRIIGSRNVANVLKNHSLRKILKSHLTSRLGNGIYQLVHYYGKTRSNRALDLLCKIREPHDKTFLDSLSDTIKEKKVMATLDLLGQIVQTAPSWTPKIALHPVFKAILQHSVATKELDECIGGLLFVTALLPHCSSLPLDVLNAVFHAFTEGCQTYRYRWLMLDNKKSSDIWERADVAHIAFALREFFYAIYGVYPTNFISYLRNYFVDKAGGTKRRDVATYVICPLLAGVRLHPNLVLVGKDKELSKDRKNAGSVESIAALLKADIYLELNSNDEWPLNHLGCNPFDFCVWGYVEESCERASVFRTVRIHNGRDELQTPFRDRFLKHVWMWIVDTLNDSWHQRESHDFLDDCRRVVIGKIPINAINDGFDICSESESPPAAAQEIFPQLFTSNTSSNSSNYAWRDEDSENDLLKALHTPSGNTKVSPQKRISADEDWAPIVITSEEKRRRSVDAGSSRSFRNSIGSFFKRDRGNEMVSHASSDRVLEYVVDSSVAQDNGQAEEAEEAVECFTPVASQYPIALGWNS
ncbi:hypothetical protein Y032_0519g2830 [Ancylostoma ceylanicum]|uniref:Uncharacterized protein n=1 Tax=Ancylostoma ceylanicum TaxID=53326 RepID=A0A016WSX7_9BILA|nr:hypothetical protein Y032_0519g2830 [Ancylostoma ceylanicum]